MYAAPEVGPPLVSQVVARPRWFRRLPRPMHDRLHVRSIRPAGAGWLKPRVVSRFTVWPGRAVTAAEPTADGVALTLDDGTRRVVDHVVLGTGYRVDVSRYPFLGEPLLAGLERVDGFPVLDRGLESSVPGLHFVGAPAARTYGPLMRFVAGTAFASRALLEGVDATATGTGRRSHSRVA
jgi:hypothetical protein